MKWKKRNLLTVMLFYISDPGVAVPTVLLGVQSFLFTLVCSGFQTVGSVAHWCRSHCEKNPDAKLFTGIALWNHNFQGRSCQSSEADYSIPSNGLRRFRYMTVSVQRGGHFRYMTTSVHTTSISVHVFLLYDFGTCEVHFGTSLCRYRYIARERQFIMLAVGKNARWMLVCF